MVSVDSPPGDASDEYQALFYLEKARNSLAHFQDRIRNEMEELREKEKYLNDHLARVSHVVTSNDQALQHCQRNLNSLESTVSEVYGSKSAVESVAGTLETENTELRNRLRKFYKIEIRRAGRKNSQQNATISAAGTRAKALLLFNNRTIASFATVRYQMDDDFALTIEEVIKRIKVPVIKGFDYLKLTRIGTDYRLSLSNQRGNQFFEHKKYDAFYANVPEEIKTIKTSGIISEKGVNWIEQNSKCGFWSCFQLKPGATEYSPDVYSIREKTQRIGYLSPTIGYFDFMLFIVSNGTHEESFHSPFLDKDWQGNFYIREDTHSNKSLNLSDKNKRIRIDLSSFDVVDKHHFHQMMSTAFP